MVINNIYERLLEIVQIPKSLEWYEKDKKIQIYLGIYRNYLKYDRGMLSLIVFKYYVPEWWSPEDDQIEKID